MLQRIKRAGQMFRMPFALHERRRARGGEQTPQVRELIVILARINPDFFHRPAFDILRPRAQTAPFVFNSPHSGAFYPQRFLDLARLDVQLDGERAELGLVERVGDALSGRGSQRSS